MSVARSRLIQRFGRDWMIYALFHCGVEYLISQNSGFWDSLQLDRFLNPHLGKKRPESIRFTQLCQSINFLKAVPFPIKWSLSNSLQKGSARQENGSILGYLKQKPTRE